MIKVLFTSDYEIHGNGEGSPLKLMVEPTYRMMELFDKYGAKLTIMADVAEILKFKEYYQKTNRDDFNYKDITEQLKFAVNNGHDVQLHIHSSYYDAVFQNGRWKSNWAEYNLAELSFDRQKAIITEGKNFLEDILQPVKKDYKCYAFRAANWSMMPSKNIVKALIENHIVIDSSVFKYGSRSGMINFDYSSAFDKTLPWPVDETDVRLKNESGRLFEFPIFCEERKLKNFISLNRFYRVLQSRIHNFKDAEPFNVPKQTEENTSAAKESNFFSKINKRHALKADFNQCTGRQLIKQLKSVQNDYKGIDIDIPFVTIGHSKLFNKLNEISLKPFLKFVNDNRNELSFATFNNFDLQALRNYHLKENLKSVSA